MRKFVVAIVFVLGAPATALASGYGVFTQGASGLGQANAVVAHPTGPSSLYFNPALLNDVPGRQVEIGTTAIYADRKVKLDSGGSEDSESSWNFPSTFYYTQQVSDKVAAGLGVFFPFGLSSKWDSDYEGRYIGTEAEMFSANINPAVSVRVNDKFSLAVGVDLLYLDTSIKRSVNQEAVAAGLMAMFPEVVAFPLGEMGDISQKFEGDGWGLGYNLGALYKINDVISLGFAYRSHIDVTIDGDATFERVHPDFQEGLSLLGGSIQNTGGDADIRLPQQVVAGVAVKPNDKWVVEIGVRWEDWESTDDLTVELDQPVLGESSVSLPRDWNSTWTYNLGGQYRVNDAVVINAGYLYGQNAVPSSTFEPLIPDTDAHLFTIGTDLSFGAWTVSGAFGWEHHESRRKNNVIGDPVTRKAGLVTDTANGDYETEIYLVGVSVGYKF